MDVHLVSSDATVPMWSLNLTARLQAKPLNIITGRGTHSTNRIGVLKPAVKSALTGEGWHVSAWDGGLIVKGKAGMYTR